MTRIIVTEKYKDGLIFCVKCKRNLPRESFPEYNLKKSYYCCKECLKKETREYNIKTRKYKGTRRTQEEIEKEKREELLKNPYEEINSTTERLTKNIGTYKEKEGLICGYCDKQGYVIANEKNLCEKHFLIECLGMGKPLGERTNSNSQEVKRKVRILSRLENLGVKI